MKLPHSISLNDGHYNGGTYVLLHRWESVMSVNVDGVFLLTAEFLGQPGGVGVRLFRPLFGVS